MAKAIVIHERCHGITKRHGQNTRCKHTTVRSKYCWQHLKTLKNFRITKSKIAGANNGLFTTKHIDKDSVITNYTGDRVVNKDPNYGNPYGLQIKKDPPTFIIADKTNETGLGRWANDCLGKCSNNSYLLYNKKKKKAYLEAKRDIEAGEEITTSYGKDYWKGIKTYHVPDIKQLRKERAKRPQVKQVKSPIIPAPAAAAVKKQPRRIVPIAVQNDNSNLNVQRDEAGNDLRMSKYYQDFLKHSQRPEYAHELAKRAKKLGYKDITFKRRLS